MDVIDRELVERLKEEERQRIIANPPTFPPPIEQPTIHYTELPAWTPGARGAAEGNFYRREVGRLLAEGHEGKWVLIKGEEVIGIWDTEAEANQVRLERFFMQDVLMKQILVREPVYRTPGWGYFRLCH